jgi:ribonuclease Z
MSNSNVKITVLGMWASAHIGETPSFLVESDNFNILLDMCPGVTRQLKRTGFQLSKLDMAFGSHVHSDHLSGATYLLFQHFLETRNQTDSKPLMFVGTKNVIDTIDTALKLYYPERNLNHNTLLIENSDETVYNSNNVTLKFASVEHAVPTTAVRIEIGKTSICYTADGFFTPALYELAKDSDLLIGEAFGTMQDTKDRYKAVKHSLGSHLNDLAIKANVKKVLPFHMSANYNQPLKKAELISEIQQNFDGEIIWGGEDLFSISL